MLKHFYVSIIVTILGLAGIGYYAGVEGLILATMLSVMEISLSFDNAIVNASILKNMDEVWQKRFLTWGILIAVFGMRLVFPIELVSFVTDLSSIEVMKLALYQPDQYSAHLIAAHPSIASFGGMFLLMVFLGFLFNPRREIHWLGGLEKYLASVGNIESMEVIAALLILVGIQHLAPVELHTTILVSGIAGISTFVIIHGAADYMSRRYIGALGKSVKHAGFMSFLYLEVLDASFSFDGVIGAFAISKDIIIITTGLGIGAFFVRSLTILFVRRRTLENYVYLEHGAHYALGALALMMLISIFRHLPEILIGSVGFVIIALSFGSSLLYNRRA